MLKINLTSVPVDDQDKALEFYTNILGFVLKHNIPVGEYKWITLVSSADESGVELVLEPMAFEPAKVYQQALKEAGIPYTAFAVDNIEDEYQRLCKLGVNFSVPPKQAGPVMMAIFDDTCGNHIQLMQEI